LKLSYGGIGITGTPAGIVVTHQDATDQLFVIGGAGNDTIDASAVVIGLVLVIVPGLKFLARVQNVYESQLE